MSSSVKSIVSTISAVEGETVGAQSQAWKSSSGKMKMKVVLTVHLLRQTTSYSSDDDLLFSLLPYF